MRPLSFVMRPTLRALQATRNASMGACTTPSGSSYRRTTIYTQMLGNLELLHLAPIAAGLYLTLERDGELHRRAHAARGQLFPLFQLLVGALENQLVVHLQDHVRADLAPLDFVVNLV